MKKNSIVVIVIFSIVFLNLVGCQANENNEKKEMLFYIGITMVKPVSELVEIFEKENDCVIKIIQGGSNDLYESIDASNRGDLYLPGSNFYRLNNYESGYFLEGQFVGYNKATLVVKKGNPLGFTGDLSALADKNNRVVICNPDSGSIGKETKKILEKYGNFEEVFANALYLTSDSRNITKAISSNEADISINWYATIFWDDNEDKVEGIIIDEKYALKKKLVFSLLKSSENKELARKFMKYASSEEGKSIFYKYGFLDDSDLDEYDEVDINE